MSDARTWRNPWAAGLILGPLIWSAGLLLRVQAVSAAQFTPAETARFSADGFAAREQLAAYAANPALTTAGYAAFLLGAVLLVPAVVVLACLAARRSPRLAAWGGLLVVFSLVARVYFAGVEQTAFEMVDSAGVDAAAATILGGYTDVSYGPWRIPVTAASGQYIGVPLLAAALYRAEIFGAGRVLILVWWATMWGGVLKAAGWGDVASGLLLSVVLATLAVRLLRDGEPRLRRRRGVLSW